MMRLAIFTKISIVIILLLLINSPISAWDTPTQNSPVNGSQTWNFIELNWSPVFYSDSYQVQFDTSSSFNSLMLMDSTIAYVDTTGFSDTHVEFSNLYFGTTYFWRVRAIAVGDTSSWSAVWNATTRDEVILSAPTQTSNIDVTVLLDWDAHIGVDYYDYQIDTSSNFNSPQLLSGIDIYFSELNNSFDTEQQMGNLRYGASYFWRVRARNSIDTSAWTVGSFFTNEFVVINSPQTGSVTSTGVLIDWLEFGGAYFYDYQLDTTNNFNSASLVSGTNMSLANGSGNSDTEEFIDDLNFGFEYKCQLFVHYLNAILQKTLPILQHFQSVVKYSQLQLHL